MSDSELFFIDREPTPVTTTNILPPIKVGATQTLVESDNSTDIELLSSTDSDDVGHVKNKFRKKLKVKRKQFQPDKKNNKNVSQPINNFSKTEEKTEIGSWEKHTKGFGSRMLAKYNYTEGSGLGPVGKGIVIPITASVRPNIKSCIGSSTFENKPKLVKKTFRKRENSESDDDVNVTGKCNLKRRSPEIKLSVEQEKMLLNKFIKKSLIDDSINKLSSFKHGLGETNLKVKKFDFRNKYNLEITDLSNDEEISDQDSESNLNDEEEVNYFLLKFEGKMENVDHTNVENFVNTLEDVVKTFKPLSKPVKIVIEKLFNIAISQWEPMSSMFEMVEFFTDCQQLVSPSIYKTIFAKTWLEKVKNFVNKDWDYKQPEQFIDFIHGWRLQIPESCLKDLFSLIVNILTHQIDLWNPLLNETGPHKWILQWVSLLDLQLKNNFKTIRSKIGACLQKWNPNDESIFDMLILYKSVFSQSDMEDFFVRFVDKKLKACVQTIFLHYDNENNQLLSKIIKWSEIVSANHIEEILTNHFFPEMLKMLKLQLRDALKTNDDDNLKLIATWYQKWIKQIPIGYRNQIDIKVKIDKMLKLMVNAKQGKAIITDEDIINVDEIRIQEFVSHNDIYGSLNMRESVDKFAQERGICFFPLLNKFYNELQIYQFDNKKIVVDRQTIYIFANGCWNDVSLSELKKMTNSTI